MTNIEHLSPGVPSGQREPILETAAKAAYYAAYDINPGSLNPDEVYPWDALTDEGGRDVWRFVAAAVLMVVVDSQPADQTAAQFQAFQERSGTGLFFYDNNGRGGLFGLRMSAFIDGHIRFATMILGRDDRVKLARKLLKGLKSYRIERV